MADNSDKVQIKITTDADLSGLDEAKTKSADATGAVANLSKSTKGFASVMRSVNGALAGFGVLTLVSKIAEVIKAIQGAKKAHADLVANIGADNAAVAVKGLRDNYNQLKTAIAEANAEIDRTRQNSDDLTAAQRRLADASLAAAEEAAVAADPSRESIIRAQYGERRAATAGQRSAADSAQAAQRLEEDIQRKEADIAQREEQIKEFMASGQEFSGRAAQAQERSVAEANRRGWSGLRGRGFLGKQFDSIERYAGYAGAYMSQAGAAFESAKSLQQEQQVDQAALEALRQRRPVLQAQATATQAESSLATGQAARRTSAAIDDAEEEKIRKEREAAAVQSRRDDIQRQIDAQLDRDAQLRAREESFHSAARDARDFASSIRPGLTRIDGRLADKDSAERSAAGLEQQAEQFSTAMISYLDKSADKIKSLTDRLNQIRYDD